MSLPPRPPGDDPADRPDPTAPLPPAPSPAPDPFAPPAWTPPPSSAPPGPPPSSPPPGPPPGPFPPQGGAPGTGSAPPFGHDSGHGPSFDDRTWALIAHLGGAAATFFSGSYIGWMPPLIAFLVRGDRPVARAHAAAALNFQLFWALVSVGITIVATCLLVVLIGALLYFALIIPWLVGTIFGIVAGVKTLNGEPFSYPAAPTWIR